MKALIMGGGGLKGVAYLGKLSSLPFSANDYDIYAGTSIGGVFSILLAIGYTIHEIMNVFTCSNVFDLFKVDLNSLLNEYGIINVHEFISTWETFVDPRMTIQDVYEQFEKELNIVGTSLSNGKAYYMNRFTSPHMPVLTALRITCCIPMMVPSVPWNEDAYIDGCFSDNFPYIHTTSLFNLKHKDVIGMCLAADEVKEDLPQDLFQFASKVCDIGMYNIVKKTPIPSHVCVLKPKSHSYNMYVTNDNQERIDYFNEVYELGSNDTFQFEETFLYVHILKARYSD